MEEYTSDISVFDVYELASAIGKEFERIIDSCGTEVVTNLMPRVINALEHLESLATKNERENTILEDLRNRILKLENDKHARAEDRLKFEKELEQIEEDWRKESSHLLTVIAKLQDENKRLNSIITNKSNSEQDGAIDPEADVNVVSQLQHQVDQLREKVRLLNIDISNKNSEVDNLENQMEHLNSALVDLNRKQKIHTSQICGFIDERTKLLIEIQDQRRQIHLLHRRLGLVQRENEDLAKSNNDTPDLRNKIVYDVDDPERPRFTTAELKEILHERNELKAKVNELQDELAFYKSHIDSQGEDERYERKYDARRTARADVCLALRFPDRTVKKSDGLQQCIPSFFPPHVTSVVNTKPELATEYMGQEELPVEGPLPPEPDDAPWKKSESGIRKLFRKLFIDQPPARKVTIPLFASKTSSSSSPTSSGTSNA